MKTLLLNLVTGITVIGIASQAVAGISLTLEPSPQTINVGDPVSMDLVIHGLAKPPSLGAFDLSFNYDPLILSAVSLTFGNQLNLGSLTGSLQTSDLTTPGIIDLAEVSFQDAADLDAHQLNSFTLGTFGFTGIGPGASSIDFAGGSLSDETGLISLQFTTVAGHVEVRSAAPAPEPASTGTWLLFGLLILPVFGRSSREVHALRRVSKISVWRSTRMKVWKWSCQGSVPAPAVSGQTDTRRRSRRLY